MTTPTTPNNVVSRRHHAAHKSDTDIYLEDHPTARLYREKEAVALFEWPAWQRLLYYMRAANGKEIAGYCVTAEDDPLRVIDTHIVKQTSGVASYLMDDEGIAQYIADRLDDGVEDPLRALAWCWHTHPGNGTEPSGTDWENFLCYWHGKPFGVMLIVGQDESTTAIAQLRSGDRFPRQIIMAQKLKVHVETLQEYCRRTEGDVSLPVSQWAAEVESLYSTHTAVRSVRQPVGYGYTGIPLAADDDDADTNSTPSANPKGLVQASDMVSLLPGDIVQISSNGAIRTVCQQPGLNNKTTCPLGYPLTQKKGSQRWAYGGQAAGSDMELPIEGGYVPGDQWQQTQALLDGLCGRFTALTRKFNVEILDDPADDWAGVLSSWSDACRRRLGGASIDRYGSNENGWTLLRKCNTDKYDSKALMSCGMMSCLPKSIAETFPEWFDSLCRWVQEELLLSMDANGLSRLTSRAAWLAAKTNFSIMNDVDDKYTAMNGQKDGQGEFFV